MFKAISIIYLLLFSVDVLADAIPITYNITMDYNSITDQFENINATGGSFIDVSTNGNFPIGININKDGVIGLIPSVAGSGNSQLGLRRTYSDFSFNLHHRNESGLNINVDAFLYFSVLRLGGITSFFNDALVNNNCEHVQSNANEMRITASFGKNCSGNTIQYNPSDTNRPIPSGTMEFGFDMRENIRTTLRNPRYKAGDYVGSVTYTGDSAFSRVGGSMTESYTFNFTIRKIKQLNSLIFPRGTEANFVVNKYGDQYMGTSELFFIVDGVFNSSDKLRFSFTSANNRNNKFNLKHISAEKLIPYNIELIDLKVGRSIAFNKNKEVKYVPNSSENIFNGKLNFNFSVNERDVDVGIFSDQLTLIVALDI